MRRCLLLTVCACNAGVVSVPDGDGPPDEGEVEDVAGVVYDAPCSPVAGAEVRPEGASRWVAADADGRFAIDAMRRGAALEVRAPGHLEASTTRRTHDVAADDLVLALLPTGFLDLTYLAAA